MVAQKSSQLLLQPQSHVLQWVNLNLSTVLQCSELLKVQSLNHQRTTYKLMKPSQAGKVQQDAVTATLAELQLSGGAATSCSHILLSPRPCCEHPRQHSKDAHQRADRTKVLTKELLFLLLRHWGWHLWTAQEKKN